MKTLIKIMIFLVMSFNVLAQWNPQFNIKKITLSDGSTFSNVGKISGIDVDQETGKIQKIEINNQHVIYGEEVNGLLLGDKGKVLDLSSFLPTNDDSQFDESLFLDQNSQSLQNFPNNGLITPDFQNGFNLQNLNIEKMRNSILRIGGDGSGGG